MKMELNGVDEVLRELNKQIKLMSGATARGLVRSAALIRRDMDQTEPLIPVDFGNLRASWFTDLQEHVLGHEIRFGFTASYAWYVHENVGAEFQRPGAGAKFFEAALKRNTGDILDIIKREILK